MDAGAAAVGNNRHKKVKRFPDAVLGFSGACKTHREAALPLPSPGFTSRVW